MKIFNYKIIGLLLFMLLCIDSYSQDESEYFYYYKGEKIFLKLDTKTIGIITEGENSPQTIKTYLADKTEQKLTQNQEDNARSSATIIDQKAQNRKDIKTYYMEITSDHPLSPLDYGMQIADYKKLPSVIAVSPCFIDENGNIKGLSSTFYVKLKDKKEVDLLYQKAEELHMEVLGHNEYMPLWFALSCNKEINALEAANLFHETGMFESTEPGFLSQITMNSTTDRVETAMKKFSSYKNEKRPDNYRDDNQILNTFSEENKKTTFNNPNLATEPNDPYYGSQWGLKNTGQMMVSFKGIDIKAEEAWSITKGSPNIKIAIYDGGIQIDHPDLKENIFGRGYDSDTNKSPSIVYNVHGTNMAGIVAAVQNNKEGISGVAPNCKLISISSSFKIPLTSFAFTNSILWANENGAAVINMSWIIDMDKSMSYIYDETISRAVTVGRNKKGIVFVGGSGNDNKNYVYFPANNSNVLAVGAIDISGARLDGYYKSNFGNDLDVMGPGQYIITTDLMGKAGLNDGNQGEYNFMNFDYSFTAGTSAATAFVSGVAALVLSVNPELTAQEVRDIIMKTAQKIRPDRYTYSNTPGHPNGTWNVEMGHGLVNAYEAVKMAQASLTCEEKVVITKNAVAPKSDKEQRKEQILESSISTPNVDTQASESITASNVIEEGENVTYHAGKFVQLIPGFMAKSGCIFEANIEGCLGNSQRKMNTFSEEKITYAFRYNTPDSGIAKNQNVNNQNQLKAEPNPFTHKITISYPIANRGKVSLAVYTMEGIKVVNLVNDSKTINGIHTIEWDASGFPAGTYLIMLTTADKKETIKVVKL